MAAVFHAYIRLLQRYTLPVQMATGAATGTLGDLIAQQAVERKGRAHDFDRTKRLALYSSCIFAPVANRWHWVLNRIHVGGKFTTVVSRVLIDMATFAPFASTMFFTAQGVLTSRPWESTPTTLGTRDVIAENLAPTVVRQWAIFGPAQVLNLSLIPLYARPPFLNACAVVWNVYLSRMQAQLSQREAFIDQAAVDTMG